MSYILSALKKAEQERINPVSPINSAGADIFTGYENAREAKGKFYKWVGFFILLLGLGSSIYLFRAEDLPATVLDQKKTVSKPEKFFQLNKPKNIQNEQGLDSKVEQSRSPGNHPGFDKTVRKLQAGQSIGTKSPELNITGYIYFENNPKLSKVFIDGKVYRLGDRLPGGGVVSSFGSRQLAVEIQGQSYQLIIQ